MRHGGGAPAAAAGESPPRLLRQLPALRPHDHCPGECACLLNCVFNLPGGCFLLDRLHFQFGEFCGGWSWLLILFLFFFTCWKGEFCFVFLLITPKFLAVHLIVITYSPIHLAGCFESNTCEKNGRSWMQSKNLDR